VSPWAKSRPIIVLSRNYTYYAPEELLCVEMQDPMVLSFGTSGSVSLKQPMKHVHLQITSMVADRVEMDEEQTVTKKVKVAKVHGALLFNEGKLFYKHLSTSPTIIAERVFDPTLVEAPNELFELELGKSVGFGQTQDVFGEVMWWYYLRLYTKSQLRRMARKAREEELAAQREILARQGLILGPNGQPIPAPPEQPAGGTPADGSTPAPGGPGKPTNG
jgi:hypothetical protein